MVEIARRTSSIRRSKGLAQEISTLMMARGTNQTQLAIEAGVGLATVGRVLHPADRQGVSAKNFVNIVSHLTDSPDLRVHLCELARIPVPEGFNDTASSIGTGDRVNRILRASGLNEDFLTMAEDIIVSTARTTIKNLRQAQEQQERLESLVPRRRTRTIQKIS